MSPEREACALSHGTMIRLNKALSAWRTPDFEAVLKREIAQLGIDQLPLQQGLSAGNYALAQPLAATILNVAELENVIRVKAGIFFKSVICGCNCADAPSPPGEIDEYCEVLLDIDKTSADTTVSLVAE